MRQRFKRVLLIALMAVLVSASIAHAASAKSVSPERWIRGVCRDASTWLDVRDAARRQVETVSANLAAGQLATKVVAKKLVLTYAHASQGTGKALNEVRAEGVPKLDGGKDITRQYQARLAEYQAVYEQARQNLARESTKDGAQFATAAREINATLTADLSEIGGDPLEDLRTVAGLVAGISASCQDVDQYLGSTIDTAGCRAALTTAREYLALEDQFQATTADSPEETALGEQIQALISRWRTEAGGCNNAAVLGPCKPLLDSAQAIVVAAATYEGAPADSPEEKTALDEWNRLDSQLISQLPKCPASPRS